MITLLIFAAFVGGACAVIDFVVEEYFDGYENTMKKFRRFLFFVAKEYWKLFCIAVTVIFYSFMAGVGFLFGAATLYHFVCKV